METGDIERFVADLQRRFPKILRRLHESELEDARNASITRAPGEPAADGDRDAPQAQRPEID